MKNLIIMLACLLLSTSSFAQDDIDSPKEPNSPKKIYLASGYVAFGGGVALPVGNFVETSKVNSNGYAKTGFMPGFLEFAMPIHRSNFGIVLNTNYCVNDIDMNAMAHSSLRYYRQPGNERYNSLFFLGGLYITIPSRYVSFDIKALAGAAIISMPDQDYITLAYSHQTYETTNTITSTASFAYGLGADLRFNLSKHSCIYVGTTLEHTNSHHTATQNYYSVIMSDTNFDMPASIGTLSIGYAVRF